jgi:hypothetical protein
MLEPITSRKLSMEVDSVYGFSRVTLSNGVITGRFLPEIGGKMISLVREESGHEFLLQPQEPAHGYRRSQWGADFESSDTSGFDECVPTVSACRYPDGRFAGQPLPDHGELWSSSWDHAWDSESLVLTARGTRLPYEMTKRVTLNGSKVVLQYRIINVSEMPLKYLWSSHPLLSVEPGACIMLPSEIQEVFVNWSRHHRLGKFGERVAWPGSQRLNVIQDMSRGSADKVFATGVHAGWCSLYKPHADESITFHFDPARVPHIGIWICQGGWPERGKGHFTVALEPCNGYPDSLEEACQRGDCPELAARGVHEWELRLELSKGPRQQNL